MKTVLITGGTGGIGEACVSLLNKMGYQVAFTYCSNHEAAQRIHSQTGSYAVYCDLAHTASIQNAVSEVTEQFGGIDILINNAGISQFRMMQDITDEDWSNMMDVNLRGAFAMSRACIPHMIRQQFGRIINIGSMWGKCGSACEVHYSASKAGLRGMTMALAKELGPSGITVNCIEPGVIATAMNSTLSEDAITELIANTPMCRIGKPDDVAALVHFLATDSASFITGQCIGVDGGFAI